MLHALLFFLLGTSVFAAPVKTSLARVDGSNHHHPAEVQPEEATHVGIWYPIIAAQGAAVTPGLAIEIRGGARIRNLDANGAILPSGIDLDKYELGHVSYRAYLCRLPGTSIEFAYLSSCLSITLEGEIEVIDMSNLLQATQTMADWVVIDDFNYWYKVPGPKSHHEDPLPIPVLQFHPNRTLAGVHQLGVRGGVDLGSIIHPSDYLDFKSLTGAYRRVPGPRTPLAHRADLMDFTVKKVGQGYETTIIVRRCNLALAAHS